MIPIISGVSINLTFGEMVQDSQSLYSYTYNAVIIHK